jgi:hypothetical protein
MINKRLSWELKTRFKFKSSKGHLTVRGGIFGLDLYWGALVPIWNNVSVDEKRWGVILYPILRIYPGKSFKCLRLLKTKTMDNVED